MRAAHWQLGAAVVAVVEEERFLAQRELHHGFFLAGFSVIEWRLAAGTRCIDVGTCMKQRLGHLSMAPVGGPMERCAVVTPASD